MKVRYTNRIYKIPNKLNFCQLSTLKLPFNLADPPKLDIKNIDILKLIKYATV